jgi:hypothetical protein
MVSFLAEAPFGLRTAVVLLRHRPLSIARWSQGQRRGLQEPFPVFENLALPPLLMDIAAASCA